MSKKIDLRVNLEKLKMLRDGIEILTTDYYGKTRDSLIEQLDEEIANLEEEEQHAKCFEEDKDGYERLTDYGREALFDKYGFKGES